MKNYCSTLIPVFSHLEQEDCCGCEACLNACSFDAIDMVEATEGFRYPKLNPIRCTDCQACVESCPVLSTADGNLILKCFAGYALNSEIVQQSSSGGMFHLLAEKFLHLVGDSYVTAVVWKDRFRSAQHICSSDPADILLMQRSKYVQSEKGLIYRHVEEKLRCGAQVLFVGCPCEVAGLKSFLKKEYEGLFTVDFVCQGPTSSSAMRQFADWIEKKYGSQIRTVNMRYPIGEWIPQHIKIEFANGKQFIKLFYNTDIGRAMHVMQRPSCYRCRFVALKHRSDMTLGDYHGADPCADYYNESGTSVVIINTEKGQRLLQMLVESATCLIPVDYREIAKSNPRLVKTWSEHLGRRRFASDLMTKGLRTAARNSLSVKHRVKNLFPQWILHLIIWMKQILLFRNNLEERSNNAECSNDRRHGDHQF
jgi:coenzyme F420-reducing hydrogenase beta subunit